ncbi:UDP-N-acetylmuramoyl-L-alanine--D-glutamate ligase [Lunatibacter salilacus]|uniref:UDP-N-acetylmuramoyl-L-alanine--D-glutamate ligase n=1 Tax=Lunatibacter salilacus TaxID=2483804 RepID=UPI00131E3FE0|nr:UDP-N-acetylmuramoyl-L-alanine--D-glutamate ligase [Lunatibacter salilacus]
MIKKIVILGAGESGVGAALLALANGYKVFVSDAGGISAPRKQQLTAAKIPFEEFGHTSGEILGADEVIKSPGIPYSNPVVQTLVGNGIPVIDELEFAYRHSRGQVIAITGTNGKTTTTLLTYHLLKTAGLNVGMGGNVGKSWAGQLAEEDYDWWVLEVSSFQIEGFIRFKPKVAVLLNITPDHLDRYGYKFENYASTKFKLVDRMDEKDHFIYFIEDDTIRKTLQNKPLKATGYPVAKAVANSRGLHAANGSLNIKWKEIEFRVRPEEMTLQGDHNKINALCAIQSALLAGAFESTIKLGLANFQNASHRMEQVATIQGVRFVNDSKGTNVDATKYALSAYSEPIIWIAGGVDKGNDYEALLPLIEGRVKGLICLGKDNEKLKSAFMGKIPQIKETQSIQEAVKTALTWGEPGDLALLSPACASFDLFKNYEDRGDQFKAAVNSLKEKIAS